MNLYLANGTGYRVAKAFIVHLFVNHLRLFVLGRRTGLLALTHFQSLDTNMCGGHTTCSLQSPQAKLACTKHTRGAR